MNNEVTQQLLNALQWRYATKVFDATRKIPAEVWQTLERALVLTPTSYGLQPYRFLVINDPVKRAELLPHSWNQKQVVDTCPGRPQPRRIRSCARLERQRLRDGAGLRAGLSRHHRQIREPVESVV